MVLSAVALIPSAPVLVPELAGGAARELGDLRAAVLAAAGELPDRWVAVGVGSANELVSDAVGSFGGYGADVRVSLAPDVDGPPTSLPLCALITGWVRGLVNGATRAEVRVVAAALDAAEARDGGRRMRAELDAAAEPVGVLVVADGANTLSPPAPGGFDEDSVVAQRALDDALGEGDAAAIALASTVAVGRVAYQVSAGLVEPRPAAARELFRGAPYGVGYFVGVWTP